MMMLPPTAKRRVAGFVIGLTATLPLSAQAQLQAIELVESGLLDSELLEEVTGVTEALELELDLDTLADELAQAAPLAEVQGLAPNMNLAIGERLPVSDGAGQVLLHEVVLDDGFRAIEGEWLLLVPSAKVALLESLSLRIIEQSALTLLPEQLIRIQVPASPKQRAALARTLAKHQITFDQHHVFDAQTEAPQLPSPTAKHTRGSDHSLSIKLGLIDTAVQQRHPSLQASNIRQRSFLAPSLRAPEAHGTSVAALWVGQGEGFSGVLPGAEVVAASVFYRRDDGGQSAPALHLIKALDWLAREQVPVINMSLAGPANALLEQAIAAASAQGIIVVAAAGNAGPAAQPLFPAAWPQVVAVTAINDAGQIYRWAVQGSHIDFAALGVNVITAQAAGGEGPASGTSMASPIIAATIAEQLARRPKVAAEQIMRELERGAQDLGAPGKDAVFGFGALYLPAKK